MKDIKKVFGNMNIIVSYNAQKKRAKIHYNVKKEVKSSIYIDNISRNVIKQR